MNFRRFVFVLCVTLAVGCDNAPATREGEGEAAEEAWTISEKDQRAIDEISALGYMNTVPAKKKQKFGVTQLDSEFVQPGLNLYFSAHANEAILMDMAGNILHRWASEFDRTFPDFEGNAWNDWKLNWADGILYPNGDLLVVQPGIALLKLNRESEILWVRRNNAHHDLDLDDEGRIYTLTQKYAPVHDGSITNAGGKTPKFMMENHVSLCSPQGETLNQVSLDEAFQASEFESVSNPDEVHDPHHSNTIIWLDGSLADRFPEFRRDNVLVSVRNTSQLVVVDMKERKVVWALKGPWARQHEPNLLENGNVLLFDNMGARPAEQRARILEFSLASAEIVWSYDGRPGKRKLRSTTEGSVLRLPNGNTLITDSNQARVIEITPEKRVVWEYMNPHPSPVKWKKGKAVMHELRRIDPEYVSDWLDVTHAQLR